LEQRTYGADHGTDWGGRIMQLIDSYNLVDMFIMGTLLISLILGIWKGFVRSLTALASLVLGVLLALKYYPSVVQYLDKISKLDPQISMIIAMVIIFILVQIIFLIIRRVLDFLLDLTRLTWLDRILGAIMGIVAGLIIVAAGVQILLIGVPDWPIVKTSKLVIPIDRLTAKALLYAPKDARDQWQAFISKWKGAQ
jgi:membrane protein required for colicin V production